MKPSPPLTANEIQAMYMQMLNNGQNAVFELGGPPLSISQWRDRELKRIAPLPNPE